MHARVQTNDDRIERLLCKEPMCAEACPNRPPKPITRGCEHRHLNPKLAQPTFQLSRKRFMGRQAVARGQAVTDHRQTRAIGGVDVAMHRNRQRQDQRKQPCRIDPDVTKAIS